MMIIPRDVYVADQRELGIWPRRLTGKILVRESESTTTCLKPISVWTASFVEMRDLDARDCERKSLSSGIGGNRNEPGSSGRRPSAQASPARPQNHHTRPDWLVLKASGANLRSARCNCHQDRRSHRHFLLPRLHLHSTSPSTTHTQSPLCRSEWPPRALRPV